jgi:hypothetical protein
MGVSDMWKRYSLVLLLAFVLSAVAFCSRANAANQPSAPQGPIVVELYGANGELSASLEVTDGTTIAEIVKLCHCPGESRDPSIAARVADLLRVAERETWTEVKVIFYCDWCKSRPRTPGCKRCGQ